MLFSNFLKFDPRSELSISLDITKLNQFITDYVSLNFFFNLGNDEKRKTNFLLKIKKNEHRKPLHISPGS